LSSVTNRLVMQLKDLMQRRLMITKWLSTITKKT
jgi:hypothetical protein